MQKIIKILQVYKIFNPSGGGVERHIDGINKTINDKFNISYIAKEIVNFEELNFKNQIFKSNFKNIIKQIKCTDVIHIHGARSMFNLKFFLLGKIFKKKIVYTPHCYYDGKNFFDTILKYIWDKTIEKLIYQISSNIILLNDFWMKYALDKKFDTTKIKIIPNCVVKKNYTVINQSFKKNTDQINILSLSRIDKIKRVNDIIETTKHETDKFKLHIVGNGPELDSLKQKYQQFKNVIFYGFINDQKLEKILEEIDVFVISSENEGMPTVLIEMILRNIPVIATSIPGNLAILGNHNNKFNYEVGNLKELNLILKKKEFFVNKLLYESVVKNFTWENRIKDIEDIYYE